MVSAEYSMAEITTSSYGSYYWNNSVVKDNSDVASNVTQQRDESLARVEVIVQAVILALAIFGNSCVLVALGRRRKIRSRMHMFIMHLSIADILVAFFNILPQMIWDITHNFQGGDAVCRFVKFMQVFVMYLSTYVLVMTAIDRYRAICHPLSTHNWTSRTVNLMIVGAYFLAGVFSVPQAVLFKYQERVIGSGDYDCWVHWDPPWILHAYITSFTLLVYIIPFIILSFSYGSICYTVWSKYRETREPIVKQEVTNGIVGRVMYTVPNQNTARGGKGRLHPRTHSSRGFSRAKMKTVKLTFVVILAYLICWSPFFIAQIWWLYDETAPMSSSSLVIMLLLASLNSCCNPWIYLAFSGNLVKYLSPCYKTDCWPHTRTSAYSNSDASKNRSTIELEKLGTRDNYKRMGSLTSILTTRISRTSKELTPPPKEKTPPSEVSDESPKSPHVTKRSRVHERPANEIAEAQMKWDRSMCEGHGDRKPIVSLGEKTPESSRMSESDALVTKGSNY